MTALLPFFIALIMTTDVDRLPPHSPDAEQGVLGCVLLSAPSCMPLCIEKIKSPADVFYDLRHRTIYESMLALYDSRTEIDVITLHQHLKDRQLVEQAGGITYFWGLPDGVPSIGAIDFYLRILTDKAMLRALIASCTDTVSRVSHDESNPRQLIEAHEQTILNLLTEKRDSQVSIKEAVKSALNQIEAMHQKQGATGITTGFRDFDSLTCGLHPADVIIIAGRPSSGKTSLAMNIAEHVAVDLHLPVGVNSLEMTTESLVLRMLCSRARVDGQQVRKGYLTQGDFTKIATAAGAIAKAPLYIDDTPGLSIVQLKAKARRMHQLHGIKLLVVDYLQLMVGSGKRYENRQQEVASISGGCKALAKELKIPVIVLSQLNRDVEKTGGKKSAPRKPRLSDLRESGAIEQDADVVGLLYRPNEENESVVDLDIAKQRNGPRNVIVHLAYLAGYTRFENKSRVETD